MTQESIQMASGIESDDFKRSGDYAVYDAATVAGTQLAKGFAFLATAAEQAGRYVEVTLTDDGDELELEKWTGSTGRYATPESAAVRHIYIDPEVLDELGGEETDDGYQPPESLGIEVAPSDEDAFEESQETPEDAEDDAESLLAGVGDDDSVEVEEEEDSDEEAADELLAEAEEAAE